MSERKIEALIGKTEDGKYLVASIAEPFFCFEVDSEEAADEIVGRALAFWHDSRPAVRTHITRSLNKTVTTLRPFRRLEEEDLVLA